MKIRVLVIILGALLLMGCIVNPDEMETEGTQIECDRSGELAGGWQTSEVTEDVEMALDFALAQMDTSAELEKILGVQTQVVSGLNYTIDFQLDNGEVWNTIVYQDLSGNYSMTEPPAPGRITDNCP